MNTYMFVCESYVRLARNHRCRPVGLVVVVCVRSAFGLAARGCVLYILPNRVSPPAKHSVDVGVSRLGPTLIPPTVDHDTPRRHLPPTRFAAASKRSIPQHSGTSSDDCRMIRAVQTVQLQCYCLARATSSQPLPQSAAAFSADAAL